jgi:hypothetical protein
MENTFQLKLELENYEKYYLAQFIWPEYAEPLMIGTSEYSPL